MSGQARLSVRQSPLVRAISFQDEAGGSSPPRPTASPDQRERWSSCPEHAGRGVCRIKTSYLVTVPRHEPNGHAPPVVQRQNECVSLPRFCVGALPLCSCGLAKACRTTPDVLSSLLRHDLQACGSHTLRRRSPETLAILGPDGSRRSTNTARRTWPRGSSAGHSSCYRGSQGKLLGSLGRGMQADGVWAHLPATTGPIAAVPARGCPGGVAIRPGAQSTKVCRGTSDQARRVDLGGSVSVRRMT